MLLIGVAIYWAIVYLATEWGVRWLLPTASPAAAKRTLLGARIVLYGWPFFDVVPGLVQFAVACVREAGYHQYAPIPERMEVRCQDPASPDDDFSVCSAAIDDWLRERPDDSIETRRYPWLSRAWSRHRRVRSGDPPCVDGHDADMSAISDDDMWLPVSEPSMDGRMCIFRERVSAPQARFSLARRQQLAATWRTPYEQTSIVLIDLGNRKVLAQYSVLRFVPWVGRWLRPYVNQPLVAGPTIPVGGRGPRTAAVIELIKRMPSRHSTGP